MPPLPRRGSKFEKNHQKYGEKSGCTHTRATGRVPLLKVEWALYTWYFAKQSMQNPGFLDVLCIFTRIRRIVSMMLFLL